MRRICVFCGSSPGERPVYLEAARTLGRVLVDEGLDLVYGGATVGLMGAVADTVLGAGGQVIGVIPESLVEKEIAHLGLTDLRVVGSMHERKLTMSRLADGFVALPGGMGTFEEIFEIITWAQLGMHDKPCGFLNVEGYYDPLVAFLDHATAEGFIRPAHRQTIFFEAEPRMLIRRFEGYRAPLVKKWIDRDEA